MASVKPIFKKLAQSEKSSLDLNRSDAYGLGLSIPDYNGPGAHSSLSEGRGNNRHYRSTSTETTASSKKFVHPFAQSPRPYTPPIGQTNTQRENEFARESLAISEEDYFPPRSESKLSSHRPHVNNNNEPGPAPLRIQTTSRRAYHAGSQSNLYSPLALHSSDHLSMKSPSSVRSSFDRAMPKKRSRSDITAINQADAVRQARREWDEREAAKDRKHALEEVKAMEKANAREERKQGRKSATMSEGARSKRSRSDLTSQNEKTGNLVGTDYNSTSHRTPPVHTESYGSNSRREDSGAGQSTKKNVHDLWTEFVLWLRTKVFKLGRKFTRH